MNRRHPAGGATPIRGLISRQRPQPVHMAEDDTVGGDPQPVHHSSQGRKARSAHLKAEHWCGERSHAGAEQAPAGARHGGRAGNLEGLAQRCPQRDRYTGRETAYRRATLIVIGPGTVTGQAAEQPARDSERRLGEQVAVQVVPVGGPYALAQPSPDNAHARGSEAARHSRTAPATRTRGTTVSIVSGSGGREARGRGEAGRGCRARARSRPRPRSAHPCPAAEARQRQRPRGRTLEELEHVAQQDQAIDTGQRGEQTRARPRPFEHRMAWPAPR